jgi:hypothetical protein
MGRHFQIQSLQEEEQKGLMTRKSSAEGLTASIMYPLSTTTENGTGSGPPCPRLGARMTSTLQSLAFVKAPAIRKGSFPPYLIRVGESGLSIGLV